MYWTTLANKCYSPQFRYENRSYIVALFQMKTFNITIYCFLISADISVLHLNCTGSDSSPTVQIFFHIAHPEVLLHTCYCTLGSDSYLE